MRSISDEANILLNAALTQAADANARDFVGSILLCASTGGFRRKRALLKAVENTRELAQAAVSAVTAETFALFCGERVRNADAETACISTRRADGAGVSAATEAEQTIIGDSFASMIDFVLSEMEAKDIRYCDQEIARALAVFEEQGLLQGPIRMLCARVIAEISFRIEEYGFALERIEAIRTGVDNNPQHGNPEE
ncbi:hypothetical protein [Pseudothauera rhizosphaerae]|uniref:Uncharacterized protein n=1 Tax=Pseudothauera rhizosphaerae TaxID=2565932 RepID=A0A4S4AX88_9RHOO|nr:hypothetical protein [Pseudothauera rhizosphaerae]THF64253.1 hypothetical protein E6O51_02735 [Pseudothauera rhizosphaerae]